MCIRDRVNKTGNLLLLVLCTNPKVGAIADVRVRQAVNYAIDKAAYRDAVAEKYTATGELASTILARVRSATAPMTCTRPRAAGATPPRPGRCWPRRATPTG